jgi:5-methylcytosine-specific restriction endonuclease McrA
LTAKGPRRGVVAKAEAKPGLDSCPRCGVSHWSSRGGAECSVCRYFELVTVEKAQMREAIDYLKERSMCAYCGDFGSEIEHVVPRCSRLPTYTLLACSECNQIAGGELFQSFEEKRRHIQQGLGAKWRKLIRLPEWTEDELEEMGYSMRSKIKALSAAREWAKRRTEWDWIQTFFESET